MIDRWIRPRWGVGSVRLHLDVEDLALALVLFDRIVLPKSDDAAEEQRWVENRWDPEAQAVLGARLDPLIHYVEWNDDLRERWAKNMSRLQAVAQDVEGLGYYATAHLIAESSWKDALEYGTRGTIGKPVPFAWCPRTEATFAAAVAKHCIDLNALDRENLTAPPIDVFEPDFGNAEVADNEGVEGQPTLTLDSFILSRQMIVPTRSETDTPEQILESAYKLATDPEFVEARSRMYACLAVLALEGVPEEEIIDELSKAESDYNRKVDEYNKAGLRRIIHQILPMAAEHAPKLFGVPHITGISWTVKKAEAKFDPLPPRPEIAYETGAPLALSRRVLPRVHIDGSTLTKAALRVATSH